MSITTHDFFNKNIKIRNLNSNSKNKKKTILCYL